MFVHILVGSAVCACVCVCAVCTCVRSGWPVRKDSYKICQIKLKLRRRKLHISAFYLLSVILCGNESEKSKIDFGGN